jgi:F-type H+-transporting ATPase subunit gamma
MPSLIDFRRRIRSVKNTQQITKAMKMVAAAKLRRAQQQATQSRPYAQVLGDMLRSVAAAAAEDTDHPLLAQRPEKKILLVFLSGEKGLCGAFNGQLFREGQAFLKAHAGKDIWFEFVGRKGRDFFRRRKVKEAGEWTNVLVSVQFQTARDLAKKLAEGFTAGEYDAVYTIYSEFRSALSQTPVAKRLLPLKPHDEGGVPGMKEEFIFAQPAETMLARLLPRYLEITIYQAMLESAASEHAARMTAMDSATRNAGEMVDRLTLTLNRKRQAAITTEIIEVVSGAAAAS